MLRNLVAFTVSVLLPSFACATLNVSFDARNVRATDVQPGAQVVFFAVGLVPNGYESELVRWNGIVTDEDRDRVVVYDGRRDIPCKSIWVVVDLTNSEMATAAPPGCGIRRASPAPEPFKRNRGVIEAMFNRSPYLELLYVDRGRGAWVLSGTDGDSNDIDGRPDGITTVSLSNAAPLSPDMGVAGEFKPGGILVVIDFYRLEVATVQITRAMLDGVQ